MKAVARIIFALSLLAGTHGMAETTDAAVPVPIPVKNAAPPAVKADPASMKKDTVQEKKENARKKHEERIREMQKDQDKENAAIAESLREEAKRALQQRDSRKTGGAQTYPQEPLTGSPSEK